MIIFALGVDFGMGFGMGFATGASLAAGTGLFPEILWLVAFLCAIAEYELACHKKSALKTQTC